MSSVAVSSRVVTSSRASHSLEASRCRYKTGRCSNARVVKPNGSLLLLCEFHRDQQNRTKKRSDMKYRHHRAKKRQLDKHSPRVQSLSPPANAHGLDRLLLTLPSTPSARVVRPARPALARPSLPSQLLSPIVSTPAMISSLADAHPPGAVLARRESMSSLYHASAVISPAKLRVESRERFGGRRDVASKPPSLSPLRLESSWASWQPDELRLLEYFIF